ncbi:PepSY domain-containing protein [Olivibacter sp. XZL3]|uniref:PepSY-associated TM helix domain-containing protein n=1 Tax=Olivibacter sp. XZL3 TaxID=1735116 RepID=UPI0010665F10|nr:PepSY-associated TM helix domain-containing protein [Olivibacter sp. XZL3]
MKKWIGWIHRWLGLFSGIVIIIISLSGAVYVFVDELKALCYPERLFVPVSDLPAQPLAVLKNTAQKAVGNNIRISRCDIYPSPNRSWVFRAMKTNPNGIGHWEYYTYYYRIYVNPYNGKVIYVEDTRKEFFQLILNLHTDLLLGHKIGKPLVGFSVLIFILLLLSGMVLWWPRKNKKHLWKQALTLKWNARFKRLIYDLHNVLGFYIFLPALVIALTGTVFAFSWMDKSVYALFSGGHARTERRPPSDIRPLPSTDQALNRAFQDVKCRFPDADMLSIRFGDGHGNPYDFQIRLCPGRTYHFHWFFYDSFYGTLLYSYSTNDLNRAEKVRAINFDLHVGSFAGLPGKILALCICLVCASLPITGFILWRKRK